MSQRGDVAPSTLGVDVEETAVTVRYLDDRRVTYSGPIEPVDGVLQCQPGKQVHVLITDDSATEGVMVYVNDRTTDDRILEDTGVGRVFLAAGEESELFPGVSVGLDDHAVTVKAAPGVDGRVFVFEEDETGERAFEVVAEA